MFKVKRGAIYLDERVDDIEDPIAKDEFLHLEMSQITEAYCVIAF